MRLDRAAIAQRIPHAGRMCLLDAVVQWDARAIRCVTGTHRDAANPLREAGALSVWAAIEYGAQAAAIHASLIHPVDVPRRGVLAGVRDVRAACERLDRVEDELEVRARLVHADPAGAIYDFEARALGRVLVSGRATLMHLKAAP